MMQVFQIREEKRAAIPAVTHVDGSGRLQTVSPSTNPRYHGADRSLPGTDRGADGAQHLVQRERAGRLQAAGGARLLPADEDGYFSTRQRDHFKSSQELTKALNICFISAKLWMFASMLYFRVRG